MRGNEGLLQCMLQKTLKQGVGKWCPSTTGPLLPTMTDSLLAPGRGCHFCPCQEKPQARGARSAFPHEAGPQQGLLLGKVLSGSLQRIVLCMGWVSRAQGCVTAGSQHCRAQRTLCPTNTTRSNRIFCVHNYSLDTGGGGGKENFLKFLFFLRSKIFFKFFFQKFLY